MKTGKKLYKNLKMQNVNFLSYIFVVVFMLTSCLFSFTLTDFAKADYSFADYINDSWISYQQTPQGQGTQESPYVITTPQELAFLITDTDGFYADLLNDIDISARPWFPIGYNKTTGLQSASNIVFNGYNNMISGLNTTFEGFSSNTSFFGLFGRVSNIEVMNLKVDGNIKTNAYYVGGIVAYSVSGDCLIYNCYNFVDIVKTGEGIGTGGIAGFLTNDDFLIENCRNYGSVTAQGNAGGIVGYLKSVHMVSFCYNFAPVKSISGVMSNGSSNYAISGGIIGHCSSISQIFYCYNSGNITSTIPDDLTGERQYVCAGGIVGMSIDTTILSSANHGEIIGSGSHNMYASASYLGGITGHSKRVRVDSCYSAGDITSSYVYSVKNGNVDDYCLDIKGGIVGYGVNISISKSYCPKQITSQGFTYKKSVGSSKQAFQIGFINLTNANSSNSDTVLFSYYFRIPLYGNIIGDADCTPSLNGGATISDDCYSLARRDDFEDIDFMKIKVTENGNSVNIGEINVKADIYNNVITYKSVSCNLDISKLNGSYFRVEGYEYTIGNQSASTTKRDEGYAIKRELSDINCSVVTTADNIYITPYCVIKHGNSNYPYSGANLNLAPYPNFEFSTNWENTYKQIIKTRDEILNHYRPNSWKEFNYTTVANTSQFKTLNLGDSWFTDSNLNNGYPALKSFYWVYE